MSDVLDFKNIFTCSNELLMMDIYSGADFIHMAIKIQF